MSLDTARTSACATRLQKSIVYELLTQDTSLLSQWFVN
jgi:hypothetical protein